MKKLVTMLTVGMIVAMTGCSTQEGAKPKTEQEPVKEVVVKEPEFDWSDSELVKDVPLPETDSTSIEEDRDDLFWVYINGDKDTFKAYIEKCEESGFNIDIHEIEDEAYAAYTKDGRHLSVSLDGTQYELTVKESKIKDSITWPTSGMAKMIPNPEKKVGTIAVDSSNQFTAYVGEMSEDEFKAYVEKCVANGFDQDYSKGDKYFSGKNKNGDYIHLSYGGVKTMHVNIMSAEILSE